MPARSRFLLQPDKRLAFFQGFLQRPREVGSIIPSSRFLERRIVRVKRFAVSPMDEEEAIAAIDGEKCMGCGLCQVVCPTDAIILNAVRPEEFVPA